MTRTLAVLVAFGIALGSGPVWAAAAPTDADLEEAKALHARAAARFETFDFAAAIDLWVEAYTILGADPDVASIRSAIVYNLASARVELWKRDGDAEQLRQARQLLSRYLEEQPDLATEDGTARRDREQVAAKLADIDRHLAEVEAAQSEKDIRSRDDAEPPAPRPAAPPAARDDVGGVAAERRPGTGLIIGGGIACAAGVGMLGVLAAGLVRGADAQAKGDDPSTPASELPGLEQEGGRANGMAIAGGVLAGASLATGVVLLALGAKRRRAPDVAVTGSRAAVALVVGGRF